MNRSALFESLPPAVARRARRAVVPQEFKRGRWRARPLGDAELRVLAWLCARGNPVAVDAGAMASELFGSVVLADAIAPLWNLRAAGVVRCVALAEDWTSMTVEVVAYPRGVHR